MAIAYDSAKRDRPFTERGLDLETAELLFIGPRVTFLDDRRDYGEERLVTVGILAGRMVVVCWTPRGDDRHVFSMRTANAREQDKYVGLIR
ncbi:BrnT family toxin [Methylobacterium sp. GC_Met_2]|uniref:BrnT family toxin n=1 Tax=Methylobacterium sp. GC_Met_2 TaxID=2937376 RepID=UPI00226B97B3